MSDALYGLLANPPAPLIGLVFAVMGYSLILRAMKMEEVSTELQTSISFSIKIQRTGPGVLFALFGVTLVVIAYPVALFVFIHILVILAAVAFGLMGYQLFAQGVFEASDFKAVWGDKSLLLKRAAPGTLFALFGASVLVFELWKGGTSLEKIIQ